MLACCSCFKECLIFKAAISESHLTIHTWPEHGAALIDLFTCGDSTDMLGILPTMVWFAL